MSAVLGTAQRLFMKEISLSTAFETAGIRRFAVTMPEKHAAEAKGRICYQPVTQRVPDLTPAFLCPLPAQLKPCLCSEPVAIKNAPATF
jgi:hypothetical protein